MSALDLSAEESDKRIRGLEARLRDAESELARLRAKVPPDADEVAKETRKKFLKFFLDRVNPGHLDRHHGDLSSWGPEIFREAGELGLIGINASPEIGGQGRDAGYLGLVLEELGKLAEDPIFLIATQISKNWAHLLQSLGRPELIEKYAKPLVNGELLASQAHWEPADPPNLQSVAHKMPTGWKLNGEKPFITAGAYAQVFAVFVRDHESGDALVFLVHRDDPGVTVKPVPTVGARHGGFTSLVLKDVHLGDDRLVIEADAYGRISPLAAHVAWVCSAVHLGWMQRMFGLALEALGPKVRAGQRVLDLVHVQREIGRLQMGIEVARGMFLRAMAKHRQAELDPAGEMLTFTLWHFVTERTLDTAKTLMTLMGAPGYMDESPWGRYLTHVNCLVHVGASHDLLPIQVGARHVMELEMKRLRRVGF